MSHSYRLKALATAIAVSVATPAKAISVVTDIAPIYWIANEVMDGIASAKPLISDQSSPHHNAMKPSQARMLSSADLVIWVGQENSPWLGKAISSMAPTAKSLELLRVEGTQLLYANPGLNRNNKYVSKKGSVARVDFEHRDAPNDDHDEHDGDHGHSNHDAHDGDHGHIDHDAHDGDHGHIDHDAHDEDHGYGDHDEHDDDHGYGDHDAHDGDHGHSNHDAHDGDHGYGDHDAHDEDHDHGSHGSGIDPHAWLNPHNASTWAEAIAQELGRIDPKNRIAYDTNAKRFAARLQHTTKAISARISPIRNEAYFVMHNAFAYFEKVFGLMPNGIVAKKSEISPGFVSVSTVRAEMRRIGRGCLFVQPQTSRRAAFAIVENTKFEIAVLDPIGRIRTNAHDGYIGFINTIANDMITCLQK